MMYSYALFQSWYRTRKALTMDACALKQARGKLWDNLQPSLLQTPSLSPYAYRDLNEFPIITSSQVRSDITQWNSEGIQHRDAHKAAESAENGGSGEVAPGIVAGHSTGTSGSRGLFLASREERAIYLGQNLAKLIPLKSVLGGIRVLLFLRANSRLYDEGKNSGLFKFCYQPLSLSPQEKLQAIENFNPTILIAPSHVLHELAQADYQQTSLARCFYGAEPMGEDERSWITEKIGIRPDPIYQATEGFLGCSCAHGRLHLNEDSLEFELVPVSGTSGYQIIVTDLLRKTQPIVRVKLDDYIELDHAPCPCGFAGRIIQPVSGRIQNLWNFNGRVITPRAVTDILEKLLGASKKWQAIASRNSLELFLEYSISNDLAQHAVRALTQSLGIDCSVRINTLNENQKHTKRHRVLWSTGND